jgi:hypothetical protein
MNLDINEPERKFQRLQITSTADVFGASGPNKLGNLGYSSMFTTGKGKRITGGRRSFSKPKLRQLSRHDHHKH